jgi:hypothetical protein
MHADVAISKKKCGCSHAADCMYEKDPSLKVSDFIDETRAVWNLQRLREFTTA